jgi:fructose-1,6-bisphosphatase
MYDVFGSKGKNHTYYKKMSDMPDWKHKCIQAIEELAREKEFFTTYDVYCRAKELGAVIPKMLQSVGSVITFMLNEEYGCFTITDKKVRVPDNPKKLTTLLKSCQYRRNVL